MTDRKKWLESRRKGLGGSDIAAVFGLSQYTSRTELWQEKTGRMPLSTDPLTPDQKRGVLFEPVISKIFAEQYPHLEVVTDVPMARHPDYHWWIANVDGFVIRDGIKMVKEIKCPSLGAFSKILREGLPDTWILQMQHYLAAYNLERGVYIVFCADRCQMVDFEIERDEDVISMIEKAGSEFWGWVESDTPPPERAPEAPVINPHAKDVQTREDDEFRAAASRFEEAKAIEAEAKELVTLAREKLLETIQGEAGHYKNDEHRVSYTYSSKLNFDREKLFKEKPLSTVKMMEALKDHVPLDVLEAAMKGAEMHLSDYQVAGKPYPTLNIYTNREEE